MNKTKLFALLIGILVITEGIGLVYFAHRAKTASKEKEDIIRSQSVQRETVVYKKADPKLQKMYDELMEKYKAIKADRDNLLSQAKRFLSEGKTERELQATVAKLKRENELLKLEKEGALTQNDKLRDEIEQLRAQKSKIVAGETDRLKSRTELKESKVSEKKASEKSSLKKKSASREVAKERKVKTYRLTKQISKLKERVSELKKTNKELKEKYKSIESDLLKDNARLNALLEDAKDEIKTVKKKYEAEIAKLEREADAVQNNLEEKLSQTKDKLARLQSEKARAERSAFAKIDKLTKKLSDLESKYNQLTSRNKALENELKYLPRKFSEISRQNRKLLKETAEMHYNLGVFYAKNKEYKRAIAEFVKALDINPEDAYAHFNLGYIYAEYLIDRQKAIDHFRHFLRLAEGSDKDIDWVRKYLLTWETYDGKRLVE